MAQILVVGHRAVVYDGDLLYPSAVPYEVKNTLENYNKSVIDVASGDIAVVVPFANIFPVGVEQYLANKIDLSQDTWNTVNTHKLFNITGLVKVKILAEVIETGDDTSGDTAKIQLGFNGATNALIAATDVDDLAAGELWYDNTPTTSYDTPANAIIERIVNGVDIGFEITGEAATAGKIAFHCWWIPLNDIAMVTMGDGSAMV